MPEIIDQAVIRTNFARALSQMYQGEVPLYKNLQRLTEKINGDELQNNPVLRAALERADGLERINEERHGAIRLGSAAELAMMRRLFAVMDMHPVDYYDLSIANLPIHATAFRPISATALARNPFRVFTSLLRLELIADQKSRQLAAQLLAARNIFTDRTIELITCFEQQGGLTPRQAQQFISAAMHTFRMQPQAVCSRAVYQQLAACHSIVADIACFANPHINHLTPRTLNIDLAQELMPSYQMTPKAIIEGPPKRNCPILLRQTSFKAVEEAITFAEQDATDTIPPKHAARFGEIEQRGIALSSKGRELYDTVLLHARSKVIPKAGGTNAKEYMANLIECFQAFPDSWNELQQQQLAYFQYCRSDQKQPSVTDNPEPLTIQQQQRLQQLIARQQVTLQPLIYEDFLPISAAGIFQSNLASEDYHLATASSSQRQFEQHLGQPVLDSQQIYQTRQLQSIHTCLAD